MGFDPSADFVYGFEFTYRYEDYEERDSEEDFSEKLEYFLRKRGLSFVQGGLSGNNDEPFGVIGFAQDLVKYSYTSKVDLNQLKAFQEKSKQKFTLELLEEVKRFLKIKKEVKLDIFIVASLH